MFHRLHIFVNLPYLVRLNVLKIKSCLTNFDNLEVQLYSSANGEGLFEIPSLTDPIYLAPSLFS